MSNKIIYPKGMTASERNYYRTGYRDWMSGTPDKNKPWGGDRQRAYERGLEAATKIPAPRA